MNVSIIICETYNIFLFSLFTMCMLNLEEIYRSSHHVFPRTKVHIGSGKPHVNGFLGENNFTLYCYFSLCYKILWSCGLSIVVKSWELIFTKVNDNCTLYIPMIDDFDEWRSHYHIPAIWFGNIVCLQMVTPHASVHCIRHFCQYISESGQEHFPVFFPFFYKYFFSPNHRLRIHIGCLTWTLNMYSNTVSTIIWWYIIYIMYGDIIQWWQYDNK